MQLLKHCRHFLFSFMRVRELKNNALSFKGLCTLYLLLSPCRDFGSFKSAKKINGA